MNSTCYIATIRGLNAHICQICPTRKTSDLLLLQYNAWLNASVYTTETITNFGWTMLPLHQPCSVDLIPSDYHLYGPLKKIICEDIITPTTWYCRLMSPVAVDEGHQLLSGGNTCSYSKAEEGCRQRWRLHQKVTMCSAMQ